MDTPTYLDLLDAILANEGEPLIEDPDEDVAKGLAKDHAEIAISRTLVHAWTRLHQPPPIVPKSLAQMATELREACQQAIALTPQATDHLAVVRDRLTGIIEILSR